MPLIRPVSDLRNRFTEISELCHSEDQPIFITKGSHQLILKALMRQVSGVSTAASIHGLAQIFI